MNVKSQNTAIKRIAPSKPAKLVIKTYNSQSSILDFGCGRGKDCQAFSDAGLTVAGYDKFYFPVFPNQDNRFDIVMMTYVLNTIPDMVERIIALELAFYYVKPGGQLIITVRTEHEIYKQALAGDWDEYLDGYISSPTRQTFQRGYTQVELSKFLLRSIPLVDMEVLINDTDTLCIAIRK